MKYKTKQKPAKRKNNHNRTCAITRIYFYNLHSIDMGSILGLYTKKTYPKAKGDLLENSGRCSD